MRLSSMQLPVQSQEERHQDYISGHCSVLVSVDFEQVLTQELFFLTTLIRNWLAFVAD